MRLSQPLSRAILSFIFTLALAALLALPKGNGGATVEARPLPQATLQPTGVNNPSQAIDLVLQDQRTKTGDRGQFVTFNFALFNNSQCNGSVTVTVTASEVQPSPASTSLTVPPGGSQAFTISFFIPSDANPGQTYPATITANCQTTATPPTTVSDSEIVSITVTVGGQLPTNTPIATITPTLTATAGPSPTPGAACRDSFEPDDVLTAAREILPDVPQTHVICPKGDEDFVFFGGIAGKVYTIDVPAMTDGLDLSLSLYDEAGNLLAFNNDFPRNNDPTDIKPQIRSWRAPANGRYYIKVRDDAGRGGTNLSYNVVVQSESYGPTPTLVPELCTDLFEPDGVPEEASSLVIREVQPNHRFCPAGDADWVRFFAKAGQPYVLSVTSGVPGSDPVMILVDRDAATILDFSDDESGTLDPRIEFTVAVDGYYFAQLKNVGDVGSQFINYSLSFEPSGIRAQPTTQPGGPPTPTTDPNLGLTVTPTTTGTAGTPTTTTTITTAQATGTALAPTLTAIAGYPAPTQTAILATLTAIADNSLSGVKGQPAFVNGPTKDFVDPAIRGVWSRTDQVVAARQVDRSWMWGPSGLVARAEVYRQSNGGARQVQYFDKARMEITDWSRDRTNPWFVTNGLLVKELIDGKLQIGDSEFLARSPAAINVAGDADDPNGPTYASFARHLAPVADRVGQTATATLRRDGSTGTTGERPEARLATYVPETGHHIPQVFWDFLNARGPVGDGQRSDVLVDWAFAMGYPVSEPFWTTVRVGGVEREVLVQAFQRRVLTYTPTNPDGWKVEMGNVGRHYYLWRYGTQP